MSEFESSPLISSEELKALLSSEEVKIFDVRGSWNGDSKQAFSEYLEAHIPGAVFLDWTKQFLEAGVSIPLASVAPQEEAKSSFEALGISRKDTIVLYDDYHHMLAGRVWWAMRYWGVSNIKILNGGWTHWNNLGFEVSSGNVEPSKGSFEPSERRELRVSLEELVRTKDNLNLVDARGAVGFKGNDSDERSGHIPGALNIPYSDFLDSETGLFKTAAHLKELFSAKFANFGNAPTVTSCGSGYAGTVALLALASFGVEAPLFDGSFSAWKENTDLPVEKGK